MADAELIESAVLTEASPLMSAGQETGDKGIWRTRIIEADVQGSSGYYPADVLKRDGPRAFPAGTHVYLDHPTQGEDQDRPERSVKDLAGYLVDGARFENSDTDGKGLFARVQFIPEIKERIKSLAPVIGLSIRAAGQVERDDKTGRNMVRSITEGLSVDVVTRAGAGGRLVTMTESTQPDSPPVEQGATGTKIEESSSTVASGALRSEVVAMRDTLSDRIEQLSIDVARMGQVMKESQKLNKQIAEENAAMREKLESIDDRQAAVDQKLGESKQIGDVLATLIEAKLPMSSMVRIASTFRSGEDLHAKITAEREYAKKLLRESEQSSLKTSEPSGLGLTESLMGASSDLGGSSVSSEDFSEMDSFLSGKGW